MTPYDHIREAMEEIYDCGIFSEDRAAKIAWVLNKVDDAINEAIILLREEMRNEDD